MTTAYRTNSPPPKEETPALPLRIRRPQLWKSLGFLYGVGWFMAIAAAIIYVPYFASYLVVWVSPSTNPTIVNDSFLRWIAGLVVVVIAGFIAFVVSVAGIAGQEALNKRFK